MGGVEIELLAMATGARIVPRFEELTPEKLGFAKSVREVSYTGATAQMLLLKCHCSSAQVQRAVAMNRGRWTSWALPPACARCD